MSLVSVDMGQDIYFKTIIIETPDTADYLKEGSSINTLFKETEVVLGVGSISQISLQNKVEGIVTLIEQGALISKVSLKTSLGDIISIVSTKAVIDLKITVGSSVTAMVKLNEIMLAK